MSRLMHAAVAAVAVVLCATGPAGAATPKEVEAAVRKGSAYLLTFDGSTVKEPLDPDRVGATALAGLALLETGTPPDHPAVKTITARVRDASYTQTQTYQLALCVLYLDRHGDPADRPLIQVLAVRLVAGQTAGGGWSYECVPPVPAATERSLRAKLSGATLVAGGKEPAREPAGADGKPAAAGKLHPDVEKYRQGLLAAEPARRTSTDDNSNTQFGMLGVWTARRHGVPVEHALDAVEKRFLGTQGASGGWPYHGPGGGPDGSPSMTCAGLIGLAIAVGRREERVLKAEAAKAPAKPAVKPEEPPALADPFYDPPRPAPPAPQPDPPAPKPKKTDARDAAVQRGMDHLADALAGRAGRGPRGGDSDLYFLWSLERVGVIYGAARIGATDWFEYASDRLVAAQNADGSWSGRGRGGYGYEIDTAFALLVLGRSNLTRDLSAKVQRRPLDSELRAGGGEVAAAPKPAPPAAEVPIKPAPPPPGPVVPAKPTTSPTDEIAAGLVRATGAAWAAALQKVRDAKGPENTAALLAALPRLDADRRAAARDALAERLCRMTAATLRWMLKSEDAELRRAAALACAMKDDQDHVPDLVAALEDADGEVVKAARAGLRSLTGKEFATAAEWREWLAGEKK